MAAEEKNRELAEILELPPKDNMAIKLKKTNLEPGITPITGAPITVPPPQPVGVDPTGQAFKEIGGQIKQLGSIIAQVDAELTERDNKTAAGDAYVGFSNKIRGIESKYYSRKGFDAQGSFAEYQSDVDKAFNDSINDLQSGRSQEMFDNISRSRRISSANSIQADERAKLDKAHLETAGAMVEDATQTAAENFNDPVTIIGEREKIIVGVGMTADMLGWSAEQETFALENAISKMHIGVISNMLINDAAAAKDYMDTNKDEIQGTDRAKVEERVNRYGVLQESQDLSDDIHAKAIAGDLSLTEELALVPKDDADVRKTTESLIRQTRKDEEIAEIRGRDESKSAVYNILLDASIDMTGKTNAVNSLENGADRINATNILNTVQARELATQKREIETASPINTFNAKAAIDNGTITTQNQLTEGYFTKTTKTDFNNLSDYLRQGGLIGNLKPSSYNTPFEDMIGKINDNKDLYLATVDCTGHGVPGAFMSMIGNTLLNEIIAEKTEMVYRKIIN